MIKACDDDAGGLLKILKGFEFGQDFLHKISNGEHTNPQTKKRKRNKAFSQRCPKCEEGVLIMTEGCQICSNNCGFSKC
jgi:hypothetical protein